jgi:hypothetical protein
MGGLYRYRPHNDAVYQQGAEQHFSFSDLAGLFQASCRRAASNPSEKDTSADSTAATKEFPMKRLPVDPERTAESPLPLQGLADWKPRPAEPASSLSYQLVTIAAAVLLVISAAVPW